MTRDEFMKYAKDEIEKAFLNQKNRMMNLVDEAWAEGKKNAEVTGIEDIVREAIDKIYQKPPTITIPAPAPDTITLPYNPPTVNWCENDIPSGCRNCPNHPINGGSGICHCIVGTQPIMCNSTATDICNAIEKDKISGTSLDVMMAIGDGQEAKTYNACCDNHIKIIHDMMTGTVPIDENKSAVGSA